MKRLRQAAAYLAASALLIWLMAFTGEAYLTPRSAGRAFLEGHNLPEPSVELLADDGEERSFAAVGPGYFVRVYLRHRLGPLWGHGGSVFYSADESLVAEIFAPGGLVMGACDVPGAAEVSFELCLPGGDGAGESEYRWVTVETDSRGCFTYDYGNLLPEGGGEPLIGYAEARDAGGNLLCDNSRARLVDTYKGG